MASTGGVFPPRRPHVPILYPPPATCRRVERDDPGTEEIYDRPCDLCAEPHVCERATVRGAGGAPGPPLFFHRVGRGGLEGEIARASVSACPPLSGMHKHMHLHLHMQSTCTCALCCVVFCGDGGGPGAGPGVRGPGPADGSNTESTANYTVSPTDLAQNLFLLSRATQ